MVGGKTGCVNWAPERSHEDGETAGVVAVLVGQQDGVNFTRLDTGFCQTSEGFTGAQTRVEKNGRATPAHDGGVSIAAAAQDNQFHDWPILTMRRLGGKPAVFS